MKKKPITAAEMIAKLEADPEYVAARAREDSERDKRETEYRQAEASLVEELQSLGFEIESVWDLVNTRDAYPDAIPILFNHLPRPYPAPVREGIARALAVPDAKVGWDVLIQMYGDEQDIRVKDGLAVAIAAIALTDGALLDDLIALAKDVRHGQSRVLLISALERSTDPKSRVALMSLGSDPDLAPETHRMLGGFNKKKRKKR